MLRVNRNDGHQVKLRGHRVKVWNGHLGRLCQYQMPSGEGVLRVIGPFAICQIYPLAQCNGNAGDDELTNWIVRQKRWAMEKHERFSLCHKCPQTRRPSLSPSLPPSFSSSLPTPHSPSLLLSPSLPLSLSASHGHVQIRARAHTHTQTHKHKHTHTHTHTHTPKKNPRHASGFFSDEVRN